MTASRPVLVGDWRKEATTASRALTSSLNGGSASGSGRPDPTPTASGSGGKQWEAVEAVGGTRQALEQARSRLLEAWPRTWDHGQVMACTRLGELLDQVGELLDEAAYREKLATDQLGRVAGALEEYEKQGTFTHPALVAPRGKIPQPRTEEPPTPLALIPTGGATVDQLAKIWDIPKERARSRLHNYKRSGQVTPVQGLAPNGSNLPTIWSRNDD